MLGCREVAVPFPSLKSWAVVWSCRHQFHLAKIRYFVMGNCQFLPGCLPEVPLPPSLFAGHFCVFPQPKFFPSTGLLVLILLLEVVLDPLTVTPATSSISQGVNPPTHKSSRLFFEALFLLTISVHLKCRVAVP
ncbi:hypothetical protein BO85DRAFT_202715 [Aspergillus piperis CBS 112811]|uniref:Uncharacterized protein n=1 Tax=Aspergillus piperis CBS 112811 TaxID=1448313 RepID=A0A8G1VH78_9EURO|nr:hypothetical protein BO85DRAFT_202715 [Aspergillus piperis CBS 112811]RAH52340.1 hypothetical protein BO85DRAFT_202715 [Aspergillus piperis CBS 112811]